MPSSSEDEKPSAKPKHATKRQPSQVSSSKAGFQKPGGFADAKPKQKPRDGKVTREEQEDGFVDEMIQGARAKRIKRESVSPKKPKNVKREPSSYKK